MKSCLVHHLLLGPSTQHLHRPHVHGYNPIVFDKSHSVHFFSIAPHLLFTALLTLVEKQLIKCNIWLDADALYRIMLHLGRGSEMVHHAHVHLFILARQNKQIVTENERFGESFQICECIQ